MQAAITASVVLKSLILIQSISALTVVLGIVQFLRRRSRFTGRNIVTWMLIPLIMYVGCDFYETSHRETLLKQRLSQSWQWCDENGEHNLLLNTEARTYTYSLKQVGDRKEIKKSEGSTSSFKKELDVVSQETYYSLYLFDFPQRGYTSMISVDGASAPKIYVTNSKVYELR